MCVYIKLIAYSTNAKLVHSATCKSITFQCVIFRAAQCKGRLVTAHCWDVEDPRLLVCRAQRMESQDSKSFKKDNNRVMSIKLPIIGFRIKYLYIREC